MKHGAKNRSNIRKILNNNNIHTHNYDYLFVYTISSDRTLLSYLPGISVKLPAWCFTLDQLYTGYIRPTAKCQLYNASLPKPSGYRVTSGTCA